jgi:hypothetical protein
VKSGVFSSDARANDARDACVARGARGAAARAANIARGGVRAVTNSMQRLRFVKKAFLWCSICLIMI